MKRELNPREITLSTDENKIEKYSNCFTGEDFYKWIKSKSKHYISIRDARIFGQFLMDKFIFKNYHLSVKNFSISQAYLYKFVVINLFHSFF